MGLLCLASWAGATRVQAEVDFVDTVPASSEVDAYRRMLERLDGLRFVAIYMAHDPQSGTQSLRADAGFDALVREQQNLTTFLDKRFPDVFSHSLSVYEAMRAGNYMFHKVATGGNPPASSYSLPQDRATWDAVRREVRDGGSADDVLARDGSSSLALYFFKTKDHYEARRLAGEVEDAVEAWSTQEPKQHPVTHEHQTTGLLSSSHYVDERNQRELRVWGIASTVAVALVLLLAFRRPSDVIIAVASLLIAVLWTFGIMGWTGIRISFLTVFLAPLVMGVGMDYAIHILQRHREERQAGRTRGAALQQAVLRTSVAIRLAGLTTVVGLALLLFVPAPLFAEIGGVAALGIGLSVLAALTVTPALRAVWPERDVAPPRPNAGAAFQRIAAFAQRNRVPLRAAFGVLTVGFVLVAALYTRVESGSAENEFPANDPVLALRQRVEKEYGSFQNAYLVVEGDLTQPAALRALYDASFAAQKLALYHSSSSVADLLIADDSTDEGALDVLQTRARPQSGADRLPTTSAEARSDLDALYADPLWQKLAPFTITRSFDLAVLQIELRPTEDAGELVALRDALHAIRDDLRAAAGPSFEVSASGAPINRASVIDQTPRDVVLAILGVAATTGLILTFAWGRRRGADGRRMAFISTAIVLTASVWLLAAVPILDATYDGLHALGLGADNNASLNNMFLLAFALTVGVGVDNAVYLVSRYWEETEAGRSAEDALRDAWVHGGRAITLTTATTVVAFGFLAGTYFLQSKNLAILTVIGAFYTYALCLLLLPGFLRGGKPALRKT